MNKGKEKIVYAVIIVILIAIFAGAYFLLDKFLLGDESSKEVKHKEEITTMEVVEKMTSNGLSKYDLSGVIKSTNQNVSYIFMNTNRNYEVVYSNFNDATAATDNFNTNLNLVKGKYNNLVEISNIKEEKYSKYEAENSDKYIVILKIGTSHFQIETTKDNKSSAQGIISSLES